LIVFCNENVGAHHLFDEFTEREILCWKYTSGEYMGWDDNGEDEMNPKVKIGSPL
jgi:hypothetical protein